MAKFQKFMITIGAVKTNKKAMGLLSQLLSSYGENNKVCIVLVHFYHFIQCRFRNICY